MDAVAAAMAPAEERFSWTSELIDAVLALRFKDAGLARAIDAARGNEPKRKAWTALAEALHRSKGVDVPEGKIRRAMSKWQSQYKSWVQVMTTKSPAELTPADRPPSYMPVLQRYFQPNSSEPVTEQAAPANASVEATTPSAKLVLSMEAFEAAIDNEAAPQTTQQANAEPFITDTGSALPAWVAPPVPTPAGVAPVTSPRARTHNTHLPPRESTTSAQQPVLVSQSPATRPALVPHDSDEDPATSQEDFHGMLLTSTAMDSHAELPPAKHRKISQEMKIAVPIRPMCMSSTPPTQLTGHPDSCPSEPSVQLRDVIARLTEHLGNVHQEQSELQKKHVEEQLQLHRKQYEEHFAAQRKQVEAFRAVLESLQGDAVV